MGILLVKYVAHSKSRHENHVKSRPSYRNTQCTFESTSHCRAALRSHGSPTPSARSRSRQPSGSARATSGIRAAGEWSPAGGACAVHPLPPWLCIIAMSVEHCHARRHTEVPARCAQAGTSAQDGAALPGQSYQLAPPAPLNLQVSLRASQAWQQRTAIAPSLVRSVEAGVKEWRRCRAGSSMARHCMIGNSTDHQCMRELRGRANVQSAVVRGAAQAAGAPCSFYPRKYISVSWAVADLSFVAVAGVPAPAGPAAVAAGTPVG